MNINQALFIKRAKARRHIANEELRKLDIRLGNFSALSPEKKKEWRQARESIIDTCERDVDLIRAELQLDKYFIIEKD